MRLPNAPQAKVEREKITDYLLSTANPQGKSKAGFFLRFGFTSDDWQLFADALISHGAAHEVVALVETIHGPRYHVGGTIDCRMDVIQ